MSHAELNIQKFILALKPTERKKPTHYVRKIPTKEMNHEYVDKS